MWCKNKLLSGNFGNVTFYLAVIGSVLSINLAFQTGKNRSVLILVPQLAKVLGKKLKATYILCDTLISAKWLITTPCCFAAWYRINAFPWMMLIKILGSVKLHIGDSWGKMKTFVLGHFHGDTQTIGGLISFALGCVFGELRPFFPFSVMANINFAILSTLRKPETQTLGGSVIGSFALGCVFRVLRPFFPFSIMFDTNFAFPLTLRKPETQTLGGSVIGSFTLGHVFRVLRPFFPFSVMADTNFAFPSTFSKPETQTLVGSVIGSFTLGRVFRALQPFFPFSMMTNTNFVIPSTLRKPETQTLGGSVIGSFALGRVFGALRPFFPFSVMADTNFVISVDTQKTGDPNFRGISNWKFHSRTRF